MNFELFSWYSNENLIYIIIYIYLRKNLWDEALIENLQVAIYVY